MTIDEFQVAVYDTYNHRGYTSDLLTLGLGLCEEAGELAGAINNVNPLYRRRKKRTQDTIEEELGDVLFYAAAIANAIGVSLDSILLEKILKANTEGE